MPKVTSFNVLNQFQLDYENNQLIQFQFTIQKGTFDLDKVDTQIKLTDGSGNVRSGPYYSFDSNEASQNSITVTATANINSTGGFALNPGQWSMHEIRVMDKNVNYLLYRMWSGSPSVYSTFSNEFCDSHSFFNSSAIFEIINN